MNNLKIEYVDIKKLRPFAGNPRKISDEGLKKLERSIGEFGFVNPVLCWRNGAVLEVIAGHQRLKAAEEQGIETVPVVILPFDDWHKAYAYNIADNRLQDESEWDNPKLKDLIVEIDDGSFDVEFTGFDVGELENLFGDGTYGVPEPQEDQADELQKKWGVKRRQIWAIQSKKHPSRNHRILCGDATSEQDIKKLMGEDKAAMAFLSPPYWVGKEYERQKSIKEIDEFIQAACKILNFAVRKDRSRIIINTGTGFTTSFDKRKKRQMLLLIDKWANNFFEIGWNLRHVRHWIKDGRSSGFDRVTDLVDQNNEFLGTFEADEGKEKKFDDTIIDKEINLIETFYAPEGKHRGREKLIPWKKWIIKGYWDDIQGVASKSGHCASFPIELVSRHIIMYSVKKDIVLDIFLGAGTTIVAAEQWGRIGYGMEIEPKYIAVTLERLKKMGLEPKLKI